jgi:succinate dehydrogenase / fumarate reductase membrane anchor subunit
MANTDASPRVDVMRSQLGRARGLGAAHTGVHHWWQQRLTSLALLPLTAWFIVSVLRFAAADRASVLGWAHAPWNATLLVAFILATFHHLQLGLQVVIEDYVHPTTRTITMVCMKGAVFLVGLACLLAALRLAI